jgi:hypothetical protein
MGPTAQDEEETWGCRTSQRLFWELWSDINDNKANVHKLRNMIMWLCYIAPLKLEVFFFIWSKKLFCMPHNQNPIKSLCFNFHRSRVMIT